MAQPPRPWQTACQYLQQGRVQDALAVLQPAAASAPDLFENRLYLGLALAQAGQLDAAVAELQAAIELNPSSALAHYNLGAAHQGQGNNQGAAECYRRALELQPNYPQAQQSLAAIEASAMPPAQPSGAPSLRGEEPAPPPAVAGPPGPIAPPAALPEQQPPTAPPSRPPPVVLPAGRTPAARQPRKAIGLSWQAIALAVLVVGGGLFTFFVQRGQPEKALSATVRAYFGALQNQDLDALKAVVSRADVKVLEKVAEFDAAHTQAQRSIFDLRSSSEAPEGQGSYTIDHIRVVGSKATVTVTLADFPVAFYGVVDTVDERVASEHLLRRTRSSGTRATQRSATVHADSDSGVESVAQASGTLGVIVVKQGLSWKIDMGANYEALKAELPEVELPDLP